MQNLLGALYDGLIVILFVLTNGFFVAAEFALVKVRTSQLRPLAKKGGWKERMALNATEHLDAALSATQVGITLASLGLGWIGEPFVAHRIAPVLAHFGVNDPKMVNSISFAIAFVGITFVHIIFGELGPKWLAIRRPTAVSIWVAGPLLVFRIVLYPFIWVLNVTSNVLLKWAGLGPVKDSESAIPADEMEFVLTRARHAHPGDALINRLMIRSLRLRETQARQIMRPREQIVALWKKLPLDENLRTAQASGFSRFPVCGESLDDVDGILLVREWLWQIQALGPTASFEPLVRPALTFTLKTPIHSMLELFRTSRSHLAIVLDDEGRTAGLVSFEDVLEEIVGDIRDEFDIESGPIFSHQGDTIDVAGRLTMRELQAETSWSFEWQPRENVATWAERMLGHPPRRGETWTVGEFTITAIEVQGERLRRVRVTRKPAV